MPAESASQRRLMAMALRYKRGDESVLEGLSEEGKEKVKKLAESMTEEELRDFAKTSEENLPKKKERKGDEADTRVSSKVILGS